ncbi:MAG: VWA domain-containing protein, partial [Pseudomonadota bacterium]
MDKIKKSSVVFTFAALLTTLTASADDLEIYDRALSKPKILFVLDASGSMGVRDGGPTSRMTRMKAALATLLTNIRGVDVGLMKYTSRGIELIHPVVDAETNQASLLAANSTLVAGGGTPTVAAMLEAQRYLSGGPPYRGIEPNGLPNYQQPATNQCESNHIVLLTDGRPTRDTGVVSDLAPMIGSCTPMLSDRGTCGAELASHMASVDQFPAMPGDNRITLHSIGFNITSNWLESLATAGGGIYRNAASSQELLEVFRSIVNSVQLTSTAAAPTVSVNAFNQSRHRNELYYSLFQPGAFPRWEGNIKKYRLVPCRHLGVPPRCRGPS